MGIVGVVWLESKVEIGGRKMYDRKEELEHRL